MNNPVEPDQSDLLEQQNRKLSWTSMTLDEALDKFIEALRPGADAEALLDEIDEEYSEVLEALASINNKLESLEIDRQTLKAMVEIELAHRPLH